MNLDLALVEQAKAELGTNGTTDTVHRALEDVVARAARKRLASWRFDHLPEDWLDREREPDHPAPDEQ